MKFAKSPAWLVELFQALQPEVGGAPRKMFGCPCAFDNEQLFTGVFEDGLFVRLGELERKELLALRGAKPFAPMKRPMREYAVLPASMLEDEESVKGWMRRAREYVATLPPKRKSGAATRKRRRSA